jgi:hydrogenase maturation factor
MMPFGKVGSVQERNGDLKTTGVARGVGIGVFVGGKKVGVWVFVEIKLEEEKWQLVTKNITEMSNRINNGVNLYFE